MPDIYVWSANEDLKTDLEGQISKYIEGSVLNAEKPDVIVIDEDFAQYELWRDKFPATPIVFLASAPQLKSDRLNIVVKKPFKLVQFLDILKAANHKLDHSEEGYIFFNGYQLKPFAKMIEDQTCGKSFKLTEKEVDILKYLYKNDGHYVSKTDLQTNVWKYSSDVTTHTIETHIYRLRQKVEQPHRRLIITHNNGYKLGKDE
ncbi:MAG: winged-helix domain-containing protein [Alphaproteobacteria bacterium]|nr:winged-helix domain-containing protein [Alphaproteobacteria bacterium]